MAQLQQVEPPVVSRLWDTLSTMRNMLTTAINAASITDPVEVLVGYPTWTEGARVWAQALDPGFVTVDALPDVRVITRYRPEWAVVGPITVGFSVAPVSGANILFSAIPGAPANGTNIHTFFVANGIRYDAQYTTLQTDTATTVAAAVAAAINSLAVVGVSASHTGAMVTISGARFTIVNIVGTGQAHKEVGRVSRTVQVSIWTNSPWSRYAIHDAISSTLGAVDACWITLPDGGRVLILGKGERLTEQSQSSYNIYEAHLTYYVEYGVVQRATAYQIGAITDDVILVNELTPHQIIV